MKPDAATVVTHDEPPSVEADPEAATQDVAGSETDAQTNPAPKEDADAPKGGSYTAVVFFHGMGSQRRYGEVSNLVEDLERYDQEAAPQSRGCWMQDIEGKLEPSRAGQGARSQTSFVEVKYTGPRFDQRDGREYRFYEAYWAPVTAGGVPMYEVLGWLLRQISNPWRALRSPWRSRRRYRVSLLYDLWQRLERGQNAYADNDLRDLLDAYDSFERSDARAAYPAGTFAEFYRYLGDREWEKKGKRSWPDPEAPARCQRLAFEWQRNAITLELRTAVILVSFLVALFTGLLVLAAAAVGVVTTLPLTGLSSSVFGLIISLITLALTITGTRAFFQDYLGDVVFWTTYEEVNQRYEKREAILNIGVDLLRHVVSDEQCRRVVIVAHSLGTTVAYDALMEIGRYNRARRDPHEALLGPLPLNKIEFLITYGSPIDKVFYFFQNETNRMHRYHRVLENIRGDFAATPLSHNHKPHVHWINFWDRADIISGALHTPLPLTLDRGPKRFLRVDNVQVANGSLLPTTSHGAYTRNRDVIGVIYECIFQRKYAFFLPESMRRKSNWWPIYTFLDQRSAARPAKERLVWVFHFVMLGLFWIAPFLAFGVGLAGLSVQPWLADLLAGWIALFADPGSIPLVFDQRAWAWQILILAILVPIAAASALIVFWGIAVFDLLKVRWQVRRMHAEAER